MISYNSENFSLLENDFPDLYYDGQANSIKGELSFKAYYKNVGTKKKNIWKIFPCLENNDCLHGYYEIEIKLTDDLPIVYETSGKIKVLAKKQNKPLIDLHVYGIDDKCCLGLLINPNQLLATFIINWVYPYFVWQAYYEEHNEVPPCGEYPHNIKDAYKQIKNTGRNELCPCNSNKKYKNCHLQTIKETNMTFSHKTGASKLEKSGKI